MAAVHKLQAQVPTESDKHDNGLTEWKEVEHLEPPADKLTFDGEEEPKLRARTWIALAAFFMLNYVQIVALKSPSAVLTYIGKDLQNPDTQTWIVVVLSLVQAVLGPLISTASDTFQARKLLLVGSCTISFIGACIAPGSNDIYRLIGANALIGVGFATVPLAYAVPSEIVPRKWRPMAQAGMNVAGMLGTISGPFTIGALTKRDAHAGWRQFYWFQAALWGAVTIALLAGYRPPKRHTDKDHLSFGAKVRSLDLIGCALLTAGLTLFITGASLGGGLYSWTHALTMSTIVIGVALLVAFGLYEWKGTSTGILHHDLFRGGRNRGVTFALCNLLLFIEALMIFGFGLFYPVMCNLLFTKDPVIIVARLQACWMPAMVSIICWGYISTRFRTIREPLIAGFVYLTAGFIGFSTIQPGDSRNALAFSVLIGIGFGSSVILCIAGVQLSTPHKLIATATACTTSSRAVAGAVFAAIYTGAFNTRLKSSVPANVSKAALAAGLPVESVPQFVKVLSAGDSTALPKIPGITSAIISQGVHALERSFADSLRIVFIIAVPFGLVAAIACFFIGDLRDAMDYGVDAPVEDLHAKRPRDASSA